MLRKERETRRITLEEISRATKISIHYLEALECDDLARLPGGAFNKGYVRTYAQFVGADPDALVDAYVAEEQAQTQEGRIHRPDVLGELSKSINARRAGDSSWARLRIGTVVRALLVVGLLAAGAVYWILFQPPDDRDAADAAELAAPEPESAAREADLAATIPRAEEPGERRAAAGDESLPAERGPETEDARATTLVARQPAVQEEPRPSIPEESPSAKQSAEGQENAGRVEPARVVQSTPAETLDGAGVESRISISDYGVGTGVENRQLVGKSDRFATGTEVWFWTRVLGGAHGDHIRHVWLHEGRVVGSIELNIGGSHWRTQSRRALNPGSEGAWTAEARDPQGRVLARQDFTCIPE